MDEDESIDYAALFGIDMNNEPAGADDTTHEENEEGIQEAADPEEGEDAMEEGGTDGEGCDGQEEAPEEDKDHAGIRRAAEQERDAAIAQVRADALKELDAFVAAMGIHNPYTNTPIKTKAEYDAYQRQHADTQREQFMQTNGMSREQYDQFIQSLPEVRQANQTMQEAREAERKAQAQQAKAVLDEEIAKISGLDPAIKTVEDLMGAENYDQVYNLVKDGYRLADAYKLANFERLTQRAAAASRQQARNQEMGKRHLNQTQARGAGAVEVPRDIKQAYLELMPNATDAEIRANYAQYLKSNERRN